MEAGRASATAGGAALLRAAHQVLDDPPILLDPLAIRLVGTASADDLRAGRAGFEEPALRRLRMSVVVRSRYAEDTLRAAFARGLRQLVLLGAGLDSFAYRSDLVPEGLRVFEVDHPDTQAQKGARLAAAGIAIPDGVFFVPVDFERQRLHDALAASPFDAAAPAFVSWLGVVPYLTRHAIDATLAELATLAPGSEIVVQYSAPRPEALRPEVAVLAQRVAALGEPWRTFLTPDEMQAELERLGFVVLEQLGPDAALARYFAGRTDGLRPGPTSWCVHATVPRR